MLHATEPSAGLAGLAWALTFQSGTDLWFFTALPRPSRHLGKVPIRARPATFGAMAHCPECGSATPPASSVCPTCGRALPGAAKPAPAARTIVGVSAKDVLPAGLAKAAAATNAAEAAGEPPPAAKTIVGLPAKSIAS